MKKILLLAFLCHVLIIQGQEIPLSPNDDETIIATHHIPEPEESEDAIVPFAVIENVPIYKGCNEKLDNQARKKCMSDAINKHVSKNFNIKLSNSLGLPAGLQRIHVFFTIDKEGSVTDIKSRAAHPALEKEAKRVVATIPKFKKPGFQRGKAVRVTFGLPITLNIEDKIHSNNTFPLHKKCSAKLDTESLKICTKDRIKNFIKSSFDIDIAATALPQAKSTKFLVTFDINKKGKVTNVNAKANHKAIAIEAIRVAKRLPKFLKPGYDSNGKPVVTKYSLEMMLFF
ncbi:energy transducer TonB [Lacinutrix salivirga]